MKKVGASWNSSAKWDAKQFVAILRRQHVSASRQSQLTIEHPL